jgi:hypothetical protein
MAELEKDYMVPTSDDEANGKDDVNSQEYFIAK